MAVQDAAIQRLLSGQIDQGIYNQQANAITNQVTDNYNTNVAPGMASGAMASGAYGGSRQGIAQGLAASRLNGDISNQLAGLSGSMYNTAQGLMGTTANNLQSLDTQKAMQAAQLAQQQRIAEMQDLTARYGIDNQRDLGWGNINLNRELGLGGLANTAYANETNRMGTLGGLSNQAFANNTALLGTLGGLNNQKYANETGRLGTMGGLSNQQYANETGRLGTMGGLSNQQYANETSRGLGVGQLGLNYAQLGQQGQQWNDEFNRQVYNDGYSQNMNNLQVGMNLLGTLNGYNQQDLGLGTQTRDAPLNYLTQFTNLNNSIGRGGQTQTTTQQGNGQNLGTAALGGAQLGNAAMNWWNNSGYGSGSNYSNGAGDNDLANLGQSNNWWGTGG